VRHRDVPLRGLRVHFAERGEGPPLLLVHGLLVSHLEWSDVVPGLAERFRCIAVDLPGFGASDKPGRKGYPYTREAFSETLVALLDELDIEHAHVCGHSMGGSIALTLAADHPGRVDRLALVDTACYDFSVPWKGRIPLLPFVGPLVFKRLYGRAMFQDYFENDVWSEHDGLRRERVEAYYRDFDSPEARESAYEALQRTVDVSTLEQKIPRVDRPTLIVWGEDDRIFPVSLAHRLVREMQDARLTVLPGCGHAPNEQMPERTTELLLSHFGGET